MFFAINAKAQIFQPSALQQNIEGHQHGPLSGPRLGVCIIGLAYPVTVFDIPVARQVNKRRVDERDQHFKKVL